MPAGLHTKSVSSAIDPRRDGLRILATRFRGRGLPANRYDVWMANLAPSEELLQAFQRGVISWREFSQRYRREIRESSSIDRRNRTIKNHGQKFTLRLLKRMSEKSAVTLLCHCAEDEAHCHRFLLKKLIETDT